jgi:hypothetical protein
MTTVNKERATRAATALLPYDHADPEEDRWQLHVIDLLTDLRHFCDEYHIDFHDATDVSYQHYLAEQHEDNR